MIAQAPVVFVVCGQTTMSRTPFGQPDAAPEEVENGNWTADCAAATENLLLAAEAIGLGAVWTISRKTSGNRKTSTTTAGNTNFTFYLLPDARSPFPASGN